MKRRAHFGVIMDAFRERLPENEEWYRERLAICGACEYNTGNMGAEGLKEKVRLALANSIHAGRDSCSLCGCFIRQKCAAEEVACSLEESGPGRAKWNRRKIITSKADDLNFFNMAPELCNIDIDEEKSRFVVKYNPVERGEVTESPFILHWDKDKRIEIMNVKSSCGCTQVEKRLLSGNEYLLALRVDTASLPPGGTKRYAGVEYRREGQTRYLEIELQFHIRDSKIQKFKDSKIPQAEDAGVESPKAEGDLVMTETLDENGQTVITVGRQQHKT
jgi:hypothetical protein